MKIIVLTLVLAGITTCSRVNAQALASTANITLNQPKSTRIQESAPSEPGVLTIDRKEKLREALLPLLRGVFTTHREKLEVMLTIDAGWRNDSLSVEYKYYRGTNVLSLDEKLLIEKIYFTVLPEEIDELDTENDEFLFLYLRNRRRKANVEQIVSRPGTKEQESNWHSSMGIPVRAENLPLIIQYLRELRNQE